MDMKIKRLTAAALAVGLLALGACSSDKAGVHGDTYVTGERTYKDFNFDDYIKLPQYKGLTLDVEGVAVSDKDVEAAIENELYAHAETSERKDGKVKNGDAINIDFVGYMDGAAFDGGTAFGFELVIGSGTMIPGFEDAIIGQEVGTTETIDITFPDPYLGNEEMSGKSAQFDITVNFVTEYVLPELNDEFVKSISEASSVAEYREMMKEKLAEASEAKLIDNKMNTVWFTVREGCEIIKYPEAQIEDYRDEFKFVYEKTASDAGMTLEQYMKDNYGIDPEQFETDALAYAYDCVENDLAFRAIVEKEGIEISDEEYSIGLADFYARVGTQYFSDIDEFEANYGRDYIESSLLWNKLLMWMVENNTFNVK